MIETPPTKTGSDWLSEGLLSASGRGHAVLSWKQASSLFSLSQWAWHHDNMTAPAPLDTSDTRKCQAAWTKFLLFSRIYLLLWNTDWVFSVIQGINRRSSAESRLSSWLIA